MHTHKMKNVIQNCLKSLKTDQSYDNLLNKSIIIVLKCSRQVQNTSRPKGASLRAFRYLLTKTWHRSVTLELLHEPPPTSPGTFVAGASGGPLEFHTK